jgi:hypothetical protein
MELNNIDVIGESIPYANYLNSPPAGHWWFNAQL